VLVVKPHVLETLQRSTHIIFDKTGTLTMGTPTLTDMAILGDTEHAWCLKLAGAMEADNAHPLSASFVAAAVKHGVAMPMTMALEKIEYFTGQGLEARMGELRYRLGSAAFVAELTGSVMGDAVIDAASTRESSVYLGVSGTASCGGQWLARFDFCDALRPDAHQVIAHFKAQGKQIILLSGDQQSITGRVAAELGIDQAHGDQMPEQKLAFVQALQRDGAVVTMVGDGINDAAVLSAADVSFAMGGGAALAQTHADAVLLSGRLSSLVDSADIAAKTMRVIHQNLAWATVYNLVAIPAAALGLVSPWLSGVGMTLSSVLVVLNALRLLREKRKGNKDGSLILIDTAQCGRGVSGDLGVFPHG
jgi:Cu2+-exporting ATPase